MPSRLVALFTLHQRRDPDDRDDRICGCADRLAQDATRCALL
jgi:hypothetical protein